MKCGNCSLQCNHYGPDGNYIGCIVEEGPAPKDRQCINDAERRETIRDLGIPETLAELLTESGGDQ